VSEPGTESHLVLFSLHGECYALPVTTVREIIRYVAPSATAAAGGLIQGMINLRGRIVPVVDLSTHRRMRPKRRRRLAPLDAKPPPS
jgi:purine-binding chemotaxis protein CheW